MPTKHARDYRRVSQENRLTLENGPRGLARLPRISGVPVPQRLLFGIGFLAVAAATTYRLDAPTLWNDEADTAVTGRNVLQCGYPLAHDGRNVLVFGNCMGVSVDLQPRTLPPVQYYVAAFGIHFLGDDARGVRLPFALLGVLAYFPLCGLLRPLTPNAVVYATLLLLSPQVLLFHRNARYFPILSLACVTALWLLTREGGSKTIRAAGLSVLSAVMFNAHPLAAALTFASLTGMALLRRRDRLGETLAAASLGFVAWYLVYSRKEPIASVPPTIAASQAGGVGDWFTNFVTGFFAAWSDLDFVNALPLVFGAVVFVLAMSLQRSRCREIALLPISVFVAINLLLQILVTAALSGSETQWHYSVLRYMPHLFVLLPVPLFLWVESLFVDRRQALWVIVPILMINLGGISVITQPSDGRRWRVSWWLPVYAEIFRPPADPMVEVFETLRSQAPPSKETPIQVAPRFLNDVFTYYVGDIYLIAPDVEPASACQACVEAAIGEEAFARFRQPPSWGVVFGEAARVPPGYAETRVAYNRGQPDATRPELTRRSFAGDASSLNFYSLFRRSQP